MWKIQYEEFPFVNGRDKKSGLVKKSHIAIGKRINPRSAIVKNDPGRIGVVLFLFNKPSRSGFIKMGVKVDPVKCNKTPFAPPDRNLRRSDGYKTAMSSSYRRKFISLPSGAAAENRWSAG
jgi:hypothetical protein